MAGRSASRTTAHRSAGASKVVPVTRVQRDAARLRMKVDKKLGQPSSPAVTALANARKAD